jgi:sugar (pentulose or hexulose) kinase
MASSFAVARLTGEYVLDHHSASQCDPLYDLADERWAEDWAAEIAPGVPLPRLVWPVEVAGEVAAEAAAENGIPAGTPVMAGTVDAWAEAFSVGVRQPGDLMLMYGSTLFFVQVTEEPTTDPLLWATAGVEPHSRSLAAGSAHNLGAFAAAVGPPRRVVAVGGGTQASLWAQIVSDVSSISQRSRRRPSGPPTATRSWRRSAPASSPRRPTGRGPQQSSSRIRRSPRATTPSMTTICGSTRPRRR